MIDGCTWKGFAHFLFMDTYNLLNELNGCNNYSFE